MVVSPTCPFCSGSEEEKELNIFTDPKTGWRIRQNKFPAGPIHKLILPPICWTPAELRTLGGLENILIAFRMAEKEIAKHPNVSLQLVVHIGPSAGQNQGHLHWHLAQRDEKLTSVHFFKRLIDIFATRSDLVVKNYGRVLVGVGGVRAGQCFIFPVPRHQEPSFPEPSLPVLAEVIYKLVTLYNRKFISKEGMCPDFSITLRFQNGFFYGAFFPTLSHWGSTEYLALHEGLPVLLPWSHELTADHLKS